MIHLSGDVRCIFGHAYPRVFCCIVRHRLCVLVHMYARLCVHWRVSNVRERARCFTIGRPDYLVTKGCGGVGKNVRFIFTGWLSIFTVLRKTVFRFLIYFDTILTPLTH